MTRPTPIRIRDQQCWLSPERCLYWEEEQTLVLSDLHFGKTGHFRKAGIAVPQEVYKEDLHRLLQQVQFFQPRRIIFTGDLFHSAANQEHLLFARWREAIPTPELHLVRGNHDRLPDHAYTDLALILHGQSLRIGPFCFVHDPADQPEDIEPTASRATDKVRTGQAPAADGDEPGSVAPPLPPFRFAGHLHPGVRLSGLGKQSFRFPCFHVAESHCILPAFSKFTGLQLVKPAKRDRIYAVLPGSHHSEAMPSIVQLQ